ARARYRLLHRWPPSTTISAPLMARPASLASSSKAPSRSAGPLDVLVNNAGVSDSQPLLACDDQSWDRVLDTNLKGAWAVAQESARRMVAAGKGGSLINVTSILASRVAGAVGPYLAAKAGLAHLTRAMALELARHGIRVNALAPGYVMTDLNEAFLASEAGDKLRSRIPSRRFSVPADLDGALLLLASDAGRAMSGAEIVVDGGHLCSSL
ncbi:SDR family NAD(P)-dependent oxidoreductase, partial [Pseudomonas aeruginosa]